MFSPCPHTRANGCFPRLTSPNPPPDFPPTRGGLELSSNRGGRGVSGKRELKPRPAQAQTAKSCTATCRGYRRLLTHLHLRGRRCQAEEEAASCRALLVIRARWRHYSLRIGLPRHSDEILSKPRDNPVQTPGRSSFPLCDRISYVSNRFI